MNMMPARQIVFASIDTDKRDGITRAGLVGRPRA